MAKRTHLRDSPLQSSILVVCALFIGLSLFNRFFFAPKSLLLCLIILSAVLLGKGRLLYRDWFVFFAFIYLFDSLRGTIYILTCRLNLPVHVLYVIKAEKFLFGELPSVFLQKALLDQETFTWFEKSLTMIHGTHFVAFLLVGLAIWLSRPEDFSGFKTSLYWVTFLGVFLYFIIPTAPPWIASNILYLIPELVHFNAEIYNMTIPDITSGFSTNPVAAMPSLHAAFPVLCCLILWRSFRWKTLAFILYTLAVLFTIVYTGDHYVVDILAGVLLALISYLLGFHVRTARILKGFGKTVFDFTSFPASIRRYRPLVLGIPLLTMGLTLGLANRHQFLNHYHEYNYSSVPYYIDFFRNEEDYKGNFAVQLYLGNHYLLKRQYEKARHYFERAIEVSQAYLDEKMAEFQIRQITVLQSRDQAAR